MEHYRRVFYNFLKLRPLQREITAPVSLVLDERSRFKNEDKSLTLRVQVSVRGDISGHKGTSGTPLLGPNCFIFMQFLWKIGQNNRLVPPPLRLAPLVGTLLRDILDPPLNRNLSGRRSYHQKQFDWKVVYWCIWSSKHDAVMLQCWHTDVFLP